MWYVFLPLCFRCENCECVNGNLGGFSGKIANKRSEHASTQCCRFQANQSNNETSEIKCKTLHYRNWCVYERERALQRENWRKFVRPPLLLLCSRKKTFPAKFLDGASAKRLIMNNSPYIGHAQIALLSTIVDHYSFRFLFFSFLNARAFSLFLARSLARSISSSVFISLFYDSIDDSSNLDAYYTNYLCTCEMLQ